MRIQCVLLLIFITLVPKNVHAEEVVNGSEVYTYDTMLADIYLLKKQYPEAISLRVIGKTTYGAPIPALKVGQGNRNVLFVGSHHGREWLTSSLLMKMVETYSEAYTQKTNIFGYDTKILDEIAIWFVPMLNPDGVMIQQKGINHFPLAFQQMLLNMNENDLHFNRWKANGIGIDLNRQYPAGWKEINNGKKHQSFEFYKGKRPLEAKEVQALVRFTYEIDPLMEVSYHSSGRVLYWYYNNDPEVIERDYEIAKSISEKTGYKLATPPKKAIGGGFTDWFIQEFKRPGFTPEISYEVENTSPPLSVFPEEWERNKEIGLMILNEAKKRM